MNKFEIIKGVLNYTCCLVRCDVITLHKNYFVHFNDESEHIELHDEDNYRFRHFGIFTHHSISFSIPYSLLKDNNSKIEFSGKDDSIHCIEIGFWHPKFMFYNFAKTTSHSIKDRNSGLFVVEDGFINYKKK